MTFEQLMSHVVGQCILNESELSGPWITYNINHDLSILTETCVNGQSIPDTRIGVYYYSLLYQKLHYDVLLHAMSNPDANLPVLGRCLMVDFGAGPGTAALAWAEHIVRQTHELPSISYVHLDRLVEMGQLCEKFIRCDQNCGDDVHLWKYLDVPVVANDGKSWVENADYAIFVFSYILCQKSVTRDTIIEFAQLIHDVCAMLDDKPAYLLRVDANLSWSLWDVLLTELGRLEVMVTEPNLSESFQYDAIFLNPDGTVRDIRNNAGPALCDVVRIEWVPRAD